MRDRPAATQMAEAEAVMTVDEQASSLIHLSRAGAFADGRTMAEGQETAKRKSSGRRSDQCLELGE